MTNQPIFRRYFLAFSMFVLVVACGAYLERRGSGVICGFDTLSQVPTILVSQYTKEREIRWMKREGWMETRQDQNCEPSLHIPALWMRELHI